MRYVFIALPSKLWLWGRLLEKHRLFFAIDAFFELLHEPLRQRLEVATHYLF